MREQSNGDRCAWTGDPELEGAAVGQFAPQLCCDLNAELACGRATASGGACVDPETASEVDGACCESAPHSCHPSFASSINSCVWNQAESSREEGLPVPDQRTLFDACVSELELIAGGVTDTSADGDSGGVWGWTLAYSSRWD